MSDRIDELVAAVRGGYPWQEYPAKSESYIALTELATIAREAEARAAEWVDRCYQSEERALKAEAERDALAAREQVK